MYRLAAVAIKAPLSVRILPAPPRSLRTFSPRFMPWGKSPSYGHVCARNRPRATLFRSEISPPLAVLAQISPGHDCRVVVRDAYREMPSALQRTALFATRTASHEFFVILHRNVDRHRQFDSRPVGGLTARKLFSARDAPLMIVEWWFALGGRAGRFGTFLIRSPRRSPSAVGRRFGASLHCEGRLSFNPDHSLPADLQRSALDTIEERELDLLFLQEFHTSPTLRAFFFRRVARDDESRFVGAWRGI
jgi:hypothetical protein